MKLSKVLIIIAIVALVAVIWAFDLQSYLTLTELKAQSQALVEWRTEHGVLVFWLYFAIYVLATALSVPGAIILTLGAGAIFGLANGLLLASFASTIGASLAFLSARLVLRDSLEQRFGDRLKKMNQGLERDGALYLLSLRLVPLFPFFLINLLMGLTRMRLWTYYWVSQIGMLAGTAVYVNAGTQLAQLDSVQGILSAELLLSFVLLGLFPVLAKFIVAKLKQAKLYKNWQRPRRFDDNLLVIGAGAGGLVSAYIAAAVKAKVTLVEAKEMGGDCLNSGCVPSKALLHIAHGKHEAAQLASAGVSHGAAKVDFSKVMSAVQDSIAAIAPHDSVERYQGLGVNVVKGYAKLLSPWEVEITTATGVERRTARSIVLATGGRPLVPNIPGLAEANYYTSDTIWSLTELPKRLIIMGAGPIGCEFAQAFQRLGSQVCLVDMADQVLVKEDADLAEMVAQQLRADGIDLQLGQRVVSVASAEGEQQVTLEDAQGQQTQQTADAIVVAVGRQANLTGYGLAELGVITDKTISTNGLLQTNFPNIYAVGDVAGPYQFTHTASHQAWYAAVNALFSPFKTFTADYSVIPWATFTQPEIATVGLNEKAAQEQGIAYELTHYDIDDLDRAIADRKAYGRVKVLTKPGTDKILGATIASAEAANLVAEFVLAMKYKLGLNKILGTIHIYPTMPEANKYVAGNWKRAHAPEGVLRWVEKFHRWRRGG